MGADGKAALGTSMFFEDFRVGQRFTSGSRAITQADLDQFTELSGDAAAIHVDPAYAEAQGFAGPLVHGPFGIAVVFGLLYEMGLVNETAIAVRDLNWEFKAPVVVGDELSLAMTVTRCRRSRSTQRGTVNRHFRLFNAAGETVQEGTSSFVVRARSLEPQPGLAETDFCSAEWAALLAPRLEAHGGFVAATRPFDGTIGLRAGNESVQLRIYKGRVIDCARRVPHGPSFTLAASELTWLALASAPRNDFVARATRGEFSASGDTYEYLRLTKALVAVFDCVRDLAQVALAA